MFPVVERLADEFNAMGQAISVDFEGNEEDAKRPFYAQSGECSIICDDLNIQKRFTLALDSVLEAAQQARADPSQFLV